MRCSVAIYIVDCFVATLLAMTKERDCFFYVVKGSVKFYKPMTGCETVFFVEFVVVLFEFCHRGFRGCPPRRRGSPQRSAGAGEGFPLLISRPHQQT